MACIQLKIEKDESIVKHIKIIRAFDPSLSIGSIKRAIEENNFIIAFDLEYYDVVEDINNIDRKEIFRDMIGDLFKEGAQVTIYENESLIPLEVLDNVLESLAETKRQTELDIDQELGL